MGDISEVNDEFYAHAGHFSYVKKSHSIGHFNADDSCSRSVSTRPLRTDIAKLP